jgi:hypothetical protein
MKKRILPVFLFIVFSARLLCPAYAQSKAPFQIPVHGKPKDLVGDIEFEGPSALAFDSLNRPYMFHSREIGSFGYILTLRDGKWVKLQYKESLIKSFPDMVQNKRLPGGNGSIAIDESDSLYATVVVPGKGWILMYSPDLGKNFQFFKMEGSTFLEIQTRAGNPECPPAVGVLKFRKKYPTRWTSYFDLLVYIPERNGKKLVLGDPIHVTKDCFGISNHSGGYSFAVTTGNLTHIVYAEIPKKKDGGNPTYTATIDRKTRKVIAKKFLATAPPKTPDVHSTPVITADSKKHLHVLCGAHGNPFLYLRSLEPDTIQKGWSKPVNMYQKQTYATLICDPEDRLHSFYRIHPKLLYQHKKASDSPWSKPVTIVLPPKGHAGYSIFYHRFFIDRKGALYISFTFYETRTKEKGIYPRALAMSEDYGKTWRLATTDTFSKRIVKK